MYISYNVERLELVIYSIYCIAFPVKYILLKHSSNSEKEINLGIVANCIISLFFSPIHYVSLTYEDLLIFRKKGLFPPYLCGG